jgi:hypothetical protein
MFRTNLPSGAWADIREVADVTERQRRPIKRVQANLGGNAAFVSAVDTAKDLKGDGTDLTQAEQLSIAAGMGAAFDDLEKLNDLLVVAMTAGWSYAFPVSEDAVQDIPGRDLDALREVVSPYLAQLLPGFEPTPDANSPTVPSGA